MNSHKQYLKILGIKGKIAGLNGLHDIVFRHLTRIPFENVSKLLLFDREQNDRLLSIDEFLDGIESMDLGGTCYSCNPFLAELLGSLGYDVDLLGADMNEPNVHTCIRVQIGRVKYHLDVGYAAPFQYPIRLDRLPHEIVQGNFHYILDQHYDDGRYEVQIVSGGERLHGYIVNESPRSLDFFKNTIQKSFGPDQHFMNTLRITKFFRNHVVELRNRSLLFFKGTDYHKAILTDMDELEQALKVHFQLPGIPVKRAVKILEKVTEKPFFEMDDYVL